MSSLLRILSSSQGLYYLLLEYQWSTDLLLLRWSKGLHNSKSEAIHYTRTEQEHSFCYHRFKHTEVGDLASCFASLCRPSRQILRVQTPKGIQEPKATNPCWLQNQPLLSPGIKAPADFNNVSGDNTQTVQLHNTQLEQFLNRSYELFMTMKQSRGNTDALQGTSVVLRCFYTETQVKMQTEQNIWGTPFV